jgi:DNA-directed RNA polymerase specialized sigma24 family protein
MKEVKNSHSQIRLRADYFKICVQKNMTVFVVIARSFTDNSDTRKDIIQQSLANVWNRVATIKEEEFMAMNLKAYISKAVYYEGLKYKRALQKAQAIESIENYPIDEDLMQELNLAQVQREGIIDIFIDKAAWVKSVVGEENFEILLMWGVDNLSYKEIADSTGKTIPAIRNIIFSLRKKLIQES